MKPDWATRLQRTFARKYDEGFAKGLMLGKAVGARDERDRIVALLEADLCTNSEWGWTDCYGLNKEHCERLNEYIELIKVENKQDYPQALPLPPKTSENTQTSWHGF